MRDWVGLFIAIVASAVGDGESPVFHMVDETVFLVDAAAVLVLHLPLWMMFRHTHINLCISDKKSSHKISHKETPRVH